MFKAILSLVFIALLGQEAHAAMSYADSVSVDGDTIRVSAAAARHIKGEGLTAILMQAASDPVFRDGEQVGYRLSRIDSGSVFETVGLLNGDLVLEVDGMPLSDPRRSVEILRYAKGLDAFTVRLERKGVERTLQVVVALP